MNPVFFEDESMRMMTRFLDLSAERQALISSNLANVDTPGYKTLDLDFESQLNAALQGPSVPMKVTDARHFTSRFDAEGQGTATVKEVEGLTLRNDLNNVNVDREMSQLSLNALKFTMVAERLAGKFRTLKSAILEGR
ncbi:MAG: flagellar basal body rod protein FlgB [Acidobacteriota bacterium]